MVLFTVAHLSWAATIFSLVGVTLNARKLRISWLVWIIANILWATVGYVTKNQALLLLQIAYAFFGVYGWYQWKPAKPKSKSMLAHKTETTFGTTPIAHANIAVAFDAIDTLELLPWKRELLGKLVVKPIAARTLAEIEAMRDAADPEKFKKAYLGTFTSTKHHHRAAPCGCKWNANIHDDICLEHGVAAYGHERHEIIVNGNLHQVTTPYVSYEQVADLARHHHWSPVVTWYRRSHDVGGILTPGDSVMASAGLVFTTVLTEICGFIPPTPGYVPCTRPAKHSGPCAHWHQA